jgi:hypothetical protein
LIGAWGSPTHGCAPLGLILAQRREEALIVGIDSHKEPWLGALSISSAERLPQALTGDVDADCFQLGELLEGVAAAEPSAP